jgi:flavin reductase (DIM6/NTAB) family NADH-FMN oxidoreductase RutF
MKPFFNENDFPVFVITSELEGKHFGMVATWICPASLRTDELRFTLPISKFNESTKAILSRRKFILHKLPKSRFETAFNMGSKHSSEMDKFQSEEFEIHESGARILKSSLSFGAAQVLSFIEAEDRFILYCSLKDIREINIKEPILSQQDLFSQLNEDQRKILGKKYLQDSERDTPKK